MDIIRNTHKKIQQTKINLHPPSIHIALTKSTKTRKTNRNISADIFSLTKRSSDKKINDI